MASDQPVLDDTRTDGKENHGYVRSQSDHQLPAYSRDEKGHTKHLPRAASSFPVIYEVPSDSAKTDVAFVPPPAAPSAGYSHQQSRRSTGTGPHERQLSILDPMSDRVSTILVWDNLIVSTRQGKKNRFLNIFHQKFYSLGKHLLHNVRGAITGGLWAVMGMSFLLFYKLTIF